MESKIKRIYCTTFGGWWSFTPDQFRQMCEASLVAEPNYEIEDFGKRLWSVPYRYVGGFEEMDTDGEYSKKNYFPKDASIQVYNITDWTDDEFRNALEKLKEI